MKDITSLLNESKKSEYIISLPGYTNEDGLPITVHMMVDKADVEVFERFLNDLKDKGRRR